MKNNERKATYRKMYNNYIDLKIRKLRGERI